MYLSYEDYIAWLDAECTHPVKDPEYDGVGSEPCTSHSFGELVGAGKRLIKEVHGVAGDGDWYDIESNRIIAEGHPRYGDEEAGWQLHKHENTKRYVQYRTVHEFVNYRGEPE